jgi:hypothetical protein
MKASARLVAVRADSRRARRGYNIIECAHMIWLTAICDLIIGSAEYPVS